MGFFDNIKDTVQDYIHPQSTRDTYYDDGYDDYEEEPYRQEPRGRADRATSSGLLGNPSRPEAHSVSVYTRSGRYLSDNEASPQGYRSESDYRDDGAYRTADDSWRASADRVVDPDHVVEPDAVPRVDTDDAYVPSMVQPGVFGATGNTPGDVGLTAVPRVSSGKLPPYVLKPTSYDDVQMVIRRVRTNQPVVLSFKSLKIETAKRVLDFCFGLACGVDGVVEELGDRVFVVLPHGVTLSDADIAKLRSEGLAR